VPKRKLAHYRLALAPAASDAHAPGLRAQLQALLATHP
jgi:hypothetical protein